MNQAKMISLLGRPLTSVETANFDLYLKIARESLDDLLCTNLCDNSSTRYFTAWDGYSTVWTDVFTDIQEVKVEDEVVTDYVVKQNDRRNGKWYNSIVFDDRFTEDKDVEITASWGFDSMPSDLQLILANLFALVTKKNKYDATIKTKRVEDFAITIDTEVDLDAEFYRTFNRTISKYTLCDKMGIKHGAVKC